MKEEKIMDEMEEQTENETIMDELWGEDNDLVSECTVVCDNDLERLMNDIRKQWETQRPLLVRFGAPQDMIPGVVAQHFMDECKRLNEEALLLITELRAKEDIISVLKDSNILTRMLGILEKPEKREPLGILEDIIKNMPLPEDLMAYRRPRTANAECNCCPEGEGEDTDETKGDQPPEH